MIELKFTAEKPGGQIINGALSANSAGEGRRKIQNLAEKNQLKVRKIQSKSTFVYKFVRSRSEKPIRGEQKAYTKKEVEEALTRLGYQVLSINKKLLNSVRNLLMQK
jgi:type IV pilus assembly protein PilC